VYTNGSNKEERGCKERELIFCSKYIALDFAEEKGLASKMFEMDGCARASMGCIVFSGQAKYMIC
jgi:hypothetical protein